MNTSSTRPQATEPLPEPAPAPAPAPPRTRRQTARLIGWLGTLPFMLWAAVAWLGAPDWLLALLVGYGVLSLAFMAGSVWATALLQPEKPQAPLIASIILVLAALPALLLQPQGAAGLLAVLFVLHWVAERAWLRSIQPGWYRAMRAGISALVVVLLVLALLPGLR